MSVKHQQNDKRSRSWLGPFAVGLVAGILLTLSVGEWLREQAEESATVANAALEGDSVPHYAARPPEPRAALPAPAPAPEPAAPEPAPQPSAAEPAAQLAEPPAAEPQVAAAPAPSEAPAQKPTAAPAAAKAQAAPVARAPLPVAAQQPAPVQAQPAKPSAPPVVYQDPNSEDAKLAAAAQVRVKGDTNIDNMLDQALTGEKRAVAAAPAATTPPVLPQTPTRDDVVSSMSVLVPAIRGCAQGQSGLAPMSIVVLSDGRVESAALSSGPFQGTASGRCMEGVVRRARFPRFKQANFRVQFPFAVQ